MSKNHEGCDELTLLKNNFNDYPTNPDDCVIECFKNKHPNRDYKIVFDCHEFTSLCPITSQPDFGHITITYIADELCIESKALKIFLFTFRNHPSFHEEVINRILEDLVAACKPREMTVYGDFMPRGGIAIKVEATYKK